MDSQFNSLMNSYNSNYVQYKVTGKKAYETAYNAAKQGLETILNNFKEQVGSEKKDIADFYQSDADQKAIEAGQKNRKLQSGILLEKDEITAAKIRAENPSPSPVPDLITRTQYFLLGGLSVAILVLTNL
jgi:hypothetical protein